MGRSVNTAATFLKRSLKWSFRLAFAIRHMTDAELVEFHIESKCRCTEGQLS